MEVEDARGSAHEASAASVLDASASLAEVTGHDPSTEEPIVRVKDLHFAFTRGGASVEKGDPVLRGIDFTLRRGQRCVLVGDNGAGKSTLLRILAGRHIHAPGTVTVLGRSSFHDTSLNAERVLMASDWGRHSVAFAGASMSHAADIAVGDMLRDLQQRHLARRDELAELLGVNLEWRMHALSDGQKRRVQIMLQMLVPCPLFLMDEITTDLDVITRSDFLAWTKRQSEEHGVAIVYCTHIFDGLSDWATHIAHLRDGTIVRGGSLARLRDFQDRLTTGVHSPLLSMVVAWMREDREAHAKLRARRAAHMATADDELVPATPAEAAPVPSLVVGAGDAGGYAPGRSHTWGATPGMPGGASSSRSGGALADEATPAPAAARGSTRADRFGSGIVAGSGMGGAGGAAAAAAPPPAPQLRSSMGLRELMEGSKSLPARSRESERRR